MKRSLVSFLVGFTLASSLFAQTPGRKEAELPVITSLDDDDKVRIIQNEPTPGATPRSALVTVEDLRNEIGGGGGGGGSGVTDGDKGDIIVANDGADWTIDMNSVSLDKLANMTTASFLGRATAGTGNPEVLSVSAAKTILALSNVNNTSDANKPVSIATQNELNLKLNTADAAPSILIKHKDGSSSRYQPSADTNAARGTALLTAVATLVAGDELQMGATTYDIGTIPLVVPNGNISIRGAGMTATLIDCSSSTGKAAFKPGTDTYAADFTVRAVNAPCGFVSLLGQTVALRSTFERVKAWGVPAVDGWLMVNQSTSYSMTLIDCEAETTYDCLATSAGPGVATINVIRPNFRAVSPSNGLARAIVTGNTTVLDLRGGSLYVETGGGSGACVYSNGSGAAIQFHDVKTRVVGSGLTDIFANGANIQIYGGSGSGTSGAFLTDATDINVFPIATGASQSVRRNSADTAFEAFTPQSNNDNPAALAAVTTATDKLIYWTDVGTAAITGFKAVGRQVANAASPEAARNAMGASGAIWPITTGGTGGDNAADARTNLGLVIGTNVQAFDADLSSLAAAALTNKLYYRSAADTWSPVTIGSNLTFSGGTLSAAGGGGSGTIATTTNVLKGDGAGNAIAADPTSDYTVVGGTLAKGKVPIGTSGSVINYYYPMATKVTATDYTIGTTDPLELYGGVIYVTGASTITVPPVAAGASFTIIVNGGVTVSVDPNASDLIILDGTAQADGEKITSTHNSGDIAVCTYYDATGWYCSSNGWTNGG